MLDKTSKALQNKATIYKYQKPYKKKFNKKLLFSFSLFFISLVIVTFAYIKPLPYVSASSNYITIPAEQQAALPWPETGNAAIGAQYYGNLLNNNDETPAPTASTAKIYTALLIDNVKKSENLSDTYTITKNDVDIYNSYVSKNGSVLPVEIGQVITIQEAFESLLLVSANNIADTMAIWAFGSMEEYVNYANITLKEWGFVNTTIADASGYSPQTISTATDLVKAAERLLSIPYLADIVASPQISSQNVGVIYNTNKAVGSNGVVGIKTGNTDEAGGCFVLSQKIPVNEQNYVTMIVAVMGQFNVSTAVNVSLKLSQSAVAGFSYKTVVPKGEVVSEYNPSWGGSYNVVATKNTDFVIWLWKDTVIPIQLYDIKQNHQNNESVGEIIANSNNFTITTPLALEEPMQKPSLIWRISNII